MRIAVSPEYQPEGFRVFAVERDFFLVNYEEPIYENGIQLKEMLRPAVDYYMMSFVPLAAIKNTYMG